MSKHRVALTLALVLSAFVGYLFGQRDIRPLQGAPDVFSGNDFGFRADGHVGNPAEPGRGWVTGRFVVKVEGRWVEARMGGAAHPVTR